MTGRGRVKPSATITSDASGVWGCGAYATNREWFQLQWSEAWRDVHITVKELLPIVIAVALWGHQWNNQTVRCRCDNAAVVAVVNSGSSRCDKVMHLMRSLFLFSASYKVTLVAEHQYKEAHILVESLDPLSVL